MDLRSSLLPSVTVTVTATQYPARLLSRAVPGQRFMTVAGHCYEVKAKYSGASGERISISRVGQKIASIHVGVKELARLKPCSPAVLKFASAIHRLAYDQNLGKYVTSVIDRAGLPQDPSMNWSKWLDAVYRPALLPLTKDSELINDAISETVVKRLIDERVLDRFDSSKSTQQGKDEAKQVSAYLSFLFKKSVPDAQDYVRRYLGIGARGAVGKEPAERLMFHDEEENEDYDRPETQVNPEAEAKIDAEEVYQFGDAFKQWVRDHNTRRNTVLVLEWITDQVLKGETRTDIREELMQHPELKAQSGQQYNAESFKKLIAQWVEQVRLFAASEENPYRDSPLSELITEQSEKLLDSRATKKVTVGSLVLAQAMPTDTGQLPQAPYSQTTDPTVPVEPKPAPKNPNVVQQENAGAKNQQQQQQPLQQDQEDFQKPGTRVTIPPEIPGVNHA